MYSLTISGPRNQKIKGLANTASPFFASLSVFCPFSREEIVAKRVPEVTLDEKWIAPTGDRGEVLARVPELRCAVRMKWDSHGVFLCSTRSENIDADLRRKLVGDIVALVAESATARAGTKEP